jgi:uncharacterized membrane protein
MISKIRNKWFTANFVLRHRWEDGDYTDYELRQLKSTFKLGIWVKTYQAVGKRKGTSKEVFNKDNHVRVYMIGLDLIVCSVWMDFSRPTFGS